MPAIPPLKLTHDCNEHSAYLFREILDCTAPLRVAEVKTLGN